MAGNVVQFERFKNVTGWTLREIADYMRRHRWAGFVLHWESPETERVTIERVPK